MRFCKIVFHISSKITEPCNIDSSDFQVLCDHLPSSSEEIFKNDQNPSAWCSRPSGKSLDYETKSK